VASTSDDNAQNIADNDNDQVFLLLIHKCLMLSTKCRKIYSYCANKLLVLRLLSD